MRPGSMIRQVLKSFLKKPATNMYPYEKLQMDEKVRGKLKFYPEKCVGCKLCMKDCPSDAITINKVGEKQFEAVIDKAKCICCGQCIESCFKKALEFTNDVELAELDREKLKVVFRAEPKDSSGKEA